jgi:membrane peptidoglycan carboxypeptidase
MEHIQQLTMTWLRNPAARVEPRQQAAAPALPDRERVRRLAELHHRQLLQAKQRTGSHYETLRAQTEALRQFTLELTPVQADTFMNMYTEESSAVERDWMSKQSGQKVQEPLNPTLVNTLTFFVTIVAIGLAIYYVV